MTRSRHQQGFTLIELLLYIAISAVIISGIVTVLIMLMSGRAKNQTIGEGEGQGAFVMQEIGQSILNAQSISSPAAALTSTALSLQELDAAKTPTTFTVANGIVSMT